MVNLRAPAGHGVAMAGRIAFATPELVTGATGFVEAPSLFADGHLLYFHKMVNGTFAIYHVQR